MASTNNGNIAGLREQILANATFAFEGDVKVHLMLTGNRNSDRPGVVVKPDEIFNVIVHPSSGDAAGQFHAVHVLGNPLASTAYLGSKVQSTVEGALMSLLEMTGKLATDNFPGAQYELEVEGEWQKK